VDESKVEAIWSYPVSISIHDGMSFHGLAPFYMWFIRNFSTIMAHMTKAIEGTSIK